uniref:Uncharacterized protein n=1 Tax=Cannabis sativa TaxID=3483 RepID=A0A803NKV7_CANSA
MNPTEFWGGDHQVDNNLLKLLFQDHPTLCEDSSSSSSSELSISSELSEEVSSGDSSESKFQHHCYPDQLRRQFDLTELANSVSKLMSKPTLPTKKELARTKQTTRAVPATDPDIGQVMATEVENDPEVQEAS